MVPGRGVDRRFKITVIKGNISWDITYIHHSSKNIKHIKSRQTSRQPGYKNMQADRLQVASRLTGYKQTDKLQTDKLQTDRLQTDWLQTDR